MASVGAGHQYYGLRVIPYSCGRTRLGLWMGTLTNRVPLRQPCRRGSYQLWLLLWSLIHASYASPHSRRLPIQFVYIRPSCARSSQRHRWFAISFSISGMPEASSPSRLGSYHSHSSSRARVAHRVPVFCLFISVFSSLVSPHVCIRNEEVLVVLWLIPRVISILTRSCIWISVNDVCAVVSTISIPSQRRSLFSSRSFLPYWLGFQRPNTKQTEIPLCPAGRLSFSCGFQCSSAPYNSRNLQLHSPHSLGS